MVGRGPASLHRVPYYIDLFYMHYLATRIEHGGCIIIHLLPHVCLAYHPPYSVHTMCPLRRHAGPRPAKPVSLSSQVPKPSSSPFRGGPVVQWIYLDSSLVPMSPGSTRGGRVRQARWSRGEGAQISTRPACQCSMDARPPGSIAIGWMYPCSITHWLRAYIYGYCRPSHVSRLESSPSSSRHGQLESSLQECPYSE